MTSWMLWLALAGALTILELFSGTFYLLMIALGMLAGALVAFAGAAETVQLLTAAAVGAAATALLRRSRRGAPMRPTIPTSTSTSARRCMCRTGMPGATLRA